MRKSVAAVLGFVIAFPFSAAQAMPAPMPTNIELNSGLVQWGAETVADEAAEAMTKDDVMTTLQELARPYPKTVSKASMCETLADAAQAHNLPVGFFVRLINQESGFNPEVVSSAGAQGVAQFMPAVAKEWGLSNPFDPHQALVASARFLRSLFDQFGNWGLAAAAYNGGMGRVQKWIDKRGKLPDETRHYVKTITGVAAENWVGTKTRGSFSIPPRAPCQEIAYLADQPPARDVNDAPAPAPQLTKVAVVTVTKGQRSKTVVTSTKVAKAGDAAKTQVAVVTTKTKGKVTVSKVASVTSKIAAPATIVAEKSSAGKGKPGKEKSPVKVAEKAPAKTAAKAKPEKAGKKAGKGLVKLADAQAARK